MKEIQYINYSKRFALQCIPILMSDSDGNFHDGIGHCHVWVSAIYYIQRCLYTCVQRFTLT